MTASLLERRYRSALRLLPASYRARWEEDMVDTYLLGFEEEGYSLDELRPSWGELASIVALALRIRTGSAGAAVSPYAVTGAALRLFALLSILLSAAHELTDKALSLAWLHGAPGQDRRLFLSIFEGHGALAGTGEALRWLLPLCWAGAYAALLHDRRRATAVLVALATLPGLFFIAEIVTQSWSVPSAGSLLPTFSSVLTLLAVCFGFHGAAPSVRLPLLPPGQWLAAVCVLMGIAIVSWLTYADDVWASGTVFCVAALAWCAVRVRQRGDRARTGGVDAAALPLALAAVGLVLLGQRADTLRMLVHAQLHGPVIAGGWAQSAALAVLVTVLAVAGLRDAASLSGQREPAGAEDGAGRPVG